MMVRDLPTAGGVRRIGARTPLLLVLGAILVPAAASAQANGIRSGRFRLHPEVRVEGAYNTNIYREDTVEEPTAAAYLRLLPALRILNPNPGAVALEGSAGLEIRQYLDSLMSEQQSRFGLQLAASGIVGPDKAISLILAEEVRRQIEAGQGHGILAEGQETSLSQEVIDSGCVENGACTFTYWRNQTGAALKIAPGGGRLFVQPGYRFLLTRYEDTTSSDNSFHELGLRGRWRFFPKTSAVTDVIYGFRSYDNPSTDVSDTMPFRATAGLRGFVTEKLAVDLGGGYGIMFADKHEGFDGTIGRAGIRYMLTERLHLRVAYRRNFASSSMANYYTTHGLLGDVRMQVGPNFNLVANVSVSFRDFSKIRLKERSAADADPNVPEDTITGSAREDTFLVARATADWMPNDWLWLSAGYRLDKLSTNWGARISGQETYEAYTRHQILVGAGLSY